LDDEYFNISFLSRILNFGHDLQPIARLIIKKKKMEIE